MEGLMKAVVPLGDTLGVQMVATPQKAEDGHVIIKMKYSAINSGDKFFLKFPIPPGTVKSLYGIKGVSGVGEVLQAGEGVPEAYLGSQVAFYRQMKFSEHVVGAWSEYTHIPFLDCLILPEESDLEAYSGSMVNVITPYAYLQQIKAEGHQAIVCTAGTSATGMAMLAFCLTYDFPLISIVRTEEGRKTLEALGAKQVVVQSDVDFNEQLRALALELNATAIFDGVGGQILNKIIPCLAPGSVIHSYGYIGDAVPLTIHMSALAVKNITIKPFANLKTATVQDPVQLQQALIEIGKLIHMPHFKTRPGKHFRLEEINDALLYTSDNGAKPILYHEA